MLGIDQQLDGDISDALYAALASVTPPSASNPFATASDVIGSELLFTANVTDTRVGAGAMLPLYTINYPINPLVIAGKSRRIQYVLNYSKTIGNTTTILQFVIGGITLTFSGSSIGNAARTNDTYLIEVLINFRVGNQANATVTVQRYTAGSSLVEGVVAKTIALGTWNTSIANAVTINWQIVTGTSTHTAVVQQVTSELI